MLASKCRRARGLEEDGRYGGSETLSVSGQALRVVGSLEVGNEEMQRSECGRRDDKSNRKRVEAREYPCGYGVGAHDLAVLRLVRIPTQALSAEC